MIEGSVGATRLPEPFDREARDRGDAKPTPDRRAGKKPMGEDDKTGRAAVE